ATVLPERSALAYTPTYLAEKIRTARSGLEGERKQVTVLFADLKGSMEVLADRDPEEARRLLGPDAVLCSADEAAIGTHLIAEPPPGSVRKKWHRRDASPAHPAS
ncbi:MAG TPA: hypothetical protein VFU41_08665, partial [Gemmatimonadales bacterium]|nr:hypothetical protein [Gemmatimonadales bacterium]